MLGPIDLSPHLGQGQGRINWVICGGESGQKPRGQNEMIGWYRDLRDQCLAANVPFFFKQWGNFQPIGEQLIRLRAKNKEAFLDGVEWKQRVRTYGMDAA